METFSDYLSGIGDPQHRSRMEEVLSWVSGRYPNLAHRIAWNQPMFTDHGTYIIGFSVAKHHFAVAPERVTIEQFSNEIASAGYEHSKELVRIPWDIAVDYALLANMIEFNIKDKATCKSFWRK